MKTEPNSSAPASSVRTHLNVADQDAALREAIRLYWINKMSRIKAARAARGE